MNLDCTSECPHCRIVPRPIGDNREARYFCGVNEAFDPSPCPYPELRPTKPVWGPHNPFSEVTMSGNQDIVVLNKILRAVEMYRRELRMSNKVRLYNAILESDQGEMDWTELARETNKVYAELYVLERPQRRGRE